ncbi:AfsR/SARP family transcriptional regulator [Streptomyces sp. NBC_00433]
MIGYCLAEVPGSLPGRNPVLVGRPDRAVRYWEFGMANEEIHGNTPVIGAELAGGRPSQTDDGRSSDTGSVDARRIAELEREVWELRRTNEFLKEHFGSGTDVDLTPAPPPRVVSDRSPQPMAEFRALGPIEAVVGGRLVDPGAPKQRALLALLVSKVGQPVAVDMIVEELWTGKPPPSAITSLQAYVANLRRVLEPGRAPRTPASVLRTYGRGYLLDSRVVEVDVHRFSERATAGWQALDWGEPQQAVREFEAGLALWRGQAYAEVADTTYVRPDVARLEELRLSVVEGRCAALLAVGAHEMAVAELEAFTRAHPLREYGCELLSLALYRAGRQADALGVLRTNQKRLAEELGIDPRPALQHLENEILNHAPALDWRPHPRVIAKSA